MAALRVSPVEVIVLDHALSEGKALRWLKRRRVEGIPVVLLCSLGDERQIREGYRAGASLCLARPLGGISLAAHLEALLARRSSRTPAQPISGDVVLDPRRGGIAFPNGTEAELTEQHLQILELLAREAGRPVPPERLAEAVWPSVEPSEALNHLRVVIRRLRGRLGSFGWILRTARGSGYLLSVELKVRSKQTVARGQRSSRSKRNRP
jgi:DNA-binding response OmpR family regulator